MNLLFCLYAQLSILRLRDPVQGGHWAGQWRQERSNGAGTRDAKVFAVPVLGHPYLAIQPLPEHCGAHSPELFVVTCRIWWRTDVAP
ncbi:MULTISPECIES: hypothetical protein [unclassified Devosia]|uniref:hypothetical protein n=1 Tax=unclassified Devosia TaxID=196773 RepID=UPI001557CF6A|nr:MULTISPECIES: hypothetical protein [unclassified Devosia]